LNQTRIRERFGKLGKEELAAALAAVEAGKDISKMTEADLKAQTEKIALEQEMQSKFDQMGNRLKEIVMKSQCSKCNGKNKNSRSYSFPKIVLKQD
jgi:hypothetical protein